MFPCDDYEFFLRTARDYRHAGQEEASVRSRLENFSQMYGICPCITTEIWNNVAEDPNTDDILGSSKPEPKHLLWALFFLRHYPTENVAATVFRTTEKTFRKWIWLLIPLIAGMQGVVSSLVGCGSTIQVYRNK